MVPSVLSASKGDSLPSAWMNTGSLAPLTSVKAMEPSALNLNGMVWCGGVLDASAPRLR